MLGPDECAPAVIESPTQPILIVPGAPRCAHTMDSWFAAMSFTSNGPGCTQSG
jgi:hypothetical protein